MKKSTILFVAFCVGLSSLVYEIYCLKVLFLFYSETIYAASLTIAAFLSGLAFSSLLFAAYAADHKKAQGSLCLMHLALIAYALLVLTRYPLLPGILDSLGSVGAPPAIREVLKGVFVFAYLFIPAFFIGGTFPILSGLYLSGVESGIRETGRVYFVDMVGAILGALASGFLLIPYLGFERTLLAAVCLNLLTLAVLFRSLWLKTAALFFLAATLLWVFLGPNASDLFSGKDTRSILPYHARFGEILFQKNSPFGVVTVGQNAYSVKGSRALFINYRPMCTSKGKESEEALGDWVGQNSIEDSKVLCIGLGCGYTAKALAAYRNVGQLDIVEINPIVAEACEEHFSVENGQVLTLPKTRLFIEDGSHFVRNTSRRYDAIVLDVEEVRIIHSSPLFTKEYFQIYRERLNPGGMVAVWAMGNNLRFAKVLYNTIRSVFAYVEIRVFPGPVFVFYASDREFAPPERDETEAKKVRIILADSTEELNTMDNRCLEKYSDPYRMFSLPKDAKEKRLRKAP